LKKKVLLGALAFAGAFLFAASVSADHDQGADNSKYQGYTFVKGQANDKFGISQIGGIYSQSIIDQSTYHSQISTGIAQALRMHTYIWLSDGSDQAQTKRGLDYFLPKVQTPKGSIVAIDYESGATGDTEANTANIAYAMQRIKNSGYTPMLYTYKPYMLAHVNLEELAKTFGNKFVWIAAYPHSYVTTTPDYSGFPSMKYVAIWQFTDYYKAGGLDGNVDLLGVTNNGYDGTTKTDVNSTKVKPTTTTAAIKQGQAANATSKSDIAVGYTVKVNFSASKWSNGSIIPSWVKGKSYKVQQISGNRVLLAGILSWIDKSNVEILQTAKQATSISASSSSLPSGVHAQNGTFTPNQRLMVWHGAGISPTYQYYYSGESIKYVGYIDNYAAGYRYVVYKGASGSWCYVADRHLNPNYYLGYAR
jgi:GH25 family lysozyme M1 (1,4-beta-N-acetylmuramidase)